MSGRYIEAPDTQSEIAKLKRKIAALTCLINDCEGVGVGSCIGDNASTIFIEAIYEDHFDSVVTEDTFFVDTGVTIVSGDVVSVEFIYNGVIQPNTVLLPNAVTAIGSEYPGFTIEDGTKVQIVTTNPIGEVGYFDWAILRVTIKQSLSVLAQC